MSPDSPRITITCTVAEWTRAVQALAYLLEARPELAKQLWRWAPERTSALRCMEHLKQAIADEPPTRTR